MLGERLSATSKAGVDLGGRGHVDGGQFHGRRRQARQVFMNASTASIRLS